MNSSETNILIDEVLAAPLVEAGFARRGSSFFHRSESSTLALLRILTKRSNFAGKIHYCLAIRHRFLRDLNEQVAPDRDLSEINSYPFKFRPSSLLQVDLNSWTYAPINLGLRQEHFDTIATGSNSTPSEIRYSLSMICQATLGPGLILQQRLSPSEAMHQLSTHGEAAWCEELWIQDYRNHLDA